MFLSLLFLLLLCPATGSTPPVTVLSQLSNLLCPCLCCVCVSVANGNLCMHHAKISERNQCQSRFRSPICDYIIRRQMSSLAFFLGEQRRCRRDARRRDAGACIINNEMIWTLTLAKSLSQVRNGVEVETRESQRVAAATARLTQLFQLSDFC